MMRYWIGTALLAASWLLGLAYFYPPNGWAWLATIAVGVAMLYGTGDEERGAGDVSPGRTSHLVALVLFLPAVWFADWPYRAAPLLIVLGLAFELFPIRKRWSERLAAGAIAAGVVLLVQALALELYVAYTARMHELPWPLPDCLTGIAKLLGIDATTNGSTIVMHSMRQVHRLAATWELLVDPATFLFLVGGLTLLAMHRGFLARARTLALVVLAWLPLRAGLLMALYLHRVLRSDAERPLHAMNQFYSPWMLMALLAVPVLATWWFMRQGDRGRGTGDVGSDKDNPSSSPVPRLPFLAPILIALGVALFTAAIYWNPMGGRKQGRVMVVERHSQWEPTTKPYDTEWYAEPPLMGEASGYNYGLIYRYLGQFFEMSRLMENESINDATLAQCDVLVIKTPTTRYDQTEVDAVMRFVKQGGGLLLVGDHTNVFKTTTILNDFAKRMGFIFRDDLLFGFGESPYDEVYVPPRVPHPIAQWLPPMEFAVSCSVDPGTSHGRAAMLNTGLWSMGPEYHYENFHPIPQYCPEMRSGAFVQTWAAWHGKGRAAAFGDSTIFSNFCVSQPGKSELIIGMIDWLNHGNPWFDPRLWLLLIGLVPLAAGVWMARGDCPNFRLSENGTVPLVVLLSAGACGWVVASLVILAAQHRAMPRPKLIHPLQQVVIDRTTSDVPLARGLYPKGNEAGYGMLEAWIPRMGVHTARRDGDEIFSGDTIVSICPSRSVSDEYRRRLERFVADGGRLIVIDTPENARSTANGLLWPFGLTMDRNWPRKGRLTAGLKLPTVETNGACPVMGGEPIVAVDATPVAAVKRHGQGSVLAIGFGSLWNDVAMGETWMMEPDAATKARYDTLYGLLRPFLEGKPLTPVQSPKQKGTVPDQ